MGTPSTRLSHLEEAERRAAAGQLVALLASIKHVAAESVRLADDDDFLHVLGMDSIDAVELTVQLDSVFELGFGEDPDDLDRLATFGGLVDLVVARGNLGGRGDDHDDHTDG